MRLSTMGDQGRQQTGVPFGGGVRIAGAATWGGLHSCICFIERKEEGKKKKKREPKWRTYVGVGSIPTR
jgi:hypothetical protein